MASVLVFSRRSNTQLRGVAQTHQPERGDVVDMRDDDLFHWGDAIAGPASIGWWQVLVVPGALTRNIGGLLTSSKSSTGTYAWRHRIWSVDLDRLSEGQMPQWTWVISIESLFSAVTIKAQANQSSEIGQQLNILG